MASRDPQRPNVLFVLTDDQGAWAMGCAGNAEIRSPNLDRLAREGIRFESFFCTSLGSVVQIVNLFGGKEGFDQAVHELQDALYEGIA